MTSLDGCLEKHQEYFIYIISSINNDDTIKLRGPFIAVTKEFTCTGHDKTDDLRAARFLK